MNASLRAQVRQLDPPLEEQFDLTWISRRVVAEFTAAGISAIDLLPVFQRESQTRRLYRPRDTHWNTEGNALAARELAAFIRSHPTFARRLSAD